MRNKRLEPEGFEKYKEVNNNIKRCMEKAKENWIGELCSEFEEKPSRPSTEFGMQHCLQPLRSTTSAPALSKSSKTSVNKATIVPSSSTAA